MITMTAGHILGMAVTLVLITGVGFWSLRKVKNADDFASGGKRAGSGMVAGTIMGTLVGGASTIGTAQLAFHYGFSAWWFTLGAGLGCLLLGGVFAVPLYRNRGETLPQILTQEFGPVAAPVSGLFVSLGAFINIVAQMLSAVALLTTLLPISPMLAAAITMALMAAYVIFGGVWGSSMTGIAKLFLLYGSMIIAGAVCYSLAGGFGAFAALPQDSYFNLLARGFWVDGGAALSLISGVIASQSYIQAIKSAKDETSARRGALICSVAIPPIGIVGIMIGMYMKLHHPDIDAAMAFPLFIAENMPPFLGGVILATLLIAVLGTGSGLALGISTIFTKDFYQTYINKTADDRKKLAVSRVAIALTLVFACAFLFGGAKDFILQWSFLSMGLRGAAVFVPICFALFFRGRLATSWAVASMAAGAVFTLVGKFALPVGIDPALAGLLASFCVAVAGAAATRRTPPEEKTPG